MQHNDVPFRKVSHRETLQWLRLHRIPQLSDNVLARLIANTGHVDEIFQLSRSRMTALGVSPVAQALISSPRAEQSQQLDRDLGIVEHLGIELVPLSNPSYPELLREISDPPPILYARGNLELLNRPQLAMVGSRRSSRQAGENAYRFAGKLARSGFTITSGLALGIDAKCHAGALSVNGATIAVLGTGIDRVYPARNNKLFDEIARHGLLLSEFTLGTAPHSYCFPRRNRIISGMSLGVLVVEAALQSGSLITARLALEHNREVYAIPSSIHNLGGKGCNALIQQGAKLVEDIDDVMDELTAWLPRSVDTECGEEANVDNPAGGSRGDSGGGPESHFTARELQLLDLLAYDPVTLEQLQLRCSWPVQELAALLITLEIKGSVENQGGLYQRLSRLSSI